MKSMQNEGTVTKANIRPQRNNANAHTPRGMGMLEGSIERDGLIGAITTAADDEIFDGSARGETLPAMGFDLADVSQVVKAEPGRVLIIESDGSSPLVHRRTDIPSADDPRAQRLGVAANRVAEVNLSWSPGVLAELRDDADVRLGDMFTADELAEYAQPAAPEPGAGGDDFDATPDEDGPTRAQSGDLWIIGGKHRLIVGDCTDPATVARLMGGERAGLVVTSPPYNQKLDTFKPSGMQKENPAFVQRMADAYTDSMPEELYQDQQVQLLDMLRQFITPNASIFYNHKIRYRDKRIISPIEWLLRASYAIRQEIIWDRGSSITLNARMFIPVDERIYWLRAGDDFVFNDTPEIKAYSTVWEIAAINEVQASAAFATEIPTRCIRAASSPNDIVLEPYCGTGTTIIAAHREGRRGYGVERDLRWADVILRRAEAEGLNVELVPSS